MKNWRWPAIVITTISLSAPANASWFESLIPTEVLPLAQGGSEDPDGPPGVIPFTTFELERSQVMQNLPCKWLSTTGGEGEARYDFLCKGGTWATVSLMLNKSPVDPNGIGRVRLLYREWPESVHPGGGEAYVAQQFLQHVANHFIPASVARDIMEAFWGRSDKKWRVWENLHIQYTYETPRETEGQFALRRLEIIGRADKLTLPKATPHAPAATPAEAGLGIAEPQSKPAPQPQITPLPQQRVNLPQPISTTTEPQEFKPLQIPSQAQPPAMDAPSIPTATPAELNTAPEPTSKAPVAPPPAISTTLVPDPDALVRQRGQAPAKFDAYNKAEELTRDVEMKATQPIAPEDRPVPVDVKPKGEAAESLKAIPMPSMSGIEESEPLATPKADNWPQGEGLGSPSNTPIAQPAPGTPEVSPDNAAQFQPSRQLPQLKFIPKAVPLEPKDSVIQFEDEKSGL